MSAFQIFAELIPSVRCGQ